MKCGHTVNYWRLGVVCSICKQSDRYREFLKLFTIKYVTTPDNFSGNFEGKKVHVELSLSKVMGHFRVTVSGNDDFSFTICKSSRQDCRDIYNNIKDGITISSLKEIGFKFSN